jgi:hypothetical protein
VPRPTVSLLLVRKSVRLLLYFPFYTTGHTHRMLCCMRYVALASKASMTVTLKSLKIRGLKHMYEATFSWPVRKLQRLTRDVCHIKTGSLQGTLIIDSHRPVP